MGNHGGHGHYRCEIIGNGEINRSITVVGNTGHFQSVITTRCIRQNIICCSVGGRGTGSYSIEPCISIARLGTNYIWIDGDLSIVSPTRSRRNITHRIIVCWT